MIFSAVTLGCKVNQYETQSIESTLASRGHVRAEAGQGCDVCVINTCAVTAESVRKSRQTVRRMKKLEPGALIAVCGCLAQLEPGEVLPLGADLVGGSGDRLEFAKEIEMLFQDKKRAGLVVTGDPFARGYFEELQPGCASGRTRAMIKIQDGCDNYCAYCIVPYARGRSRSLPAERAANHARKLAADGFREIVVTGIEISSYGKDLRDSPRLTGVLKEISKAVPNARLRLGSLDPGAITEDFCREISGLPGLCGHFHLSLQSGCDETLRRMGRKYGANDVFKAISLLRRQFPDCGVTADLITGFPGETDTEFEITMQFLEAAEFSDMHIFPFSPRPGTSAAIMPGQVEKSVRRQRAKTAAAAAARMAHSFRLKQVGRTVEVLFERKHGGLWTGLSGSYIEIAVKSDVGKNSVHHVRITAAGDEGVFGEVVLDES